MPSDSKTNKTRNHPGSSFFSHPEEHKSLLVILALASVLLAIVLLIYPYYRTTPQNASAVSSAAPTMDKAALLTRVASANAHPLTSQDKGEVFSAFSAPGSAASLTPAQRAAIVKAMNAN